MASSDLASTSFKWRIDRLRDRFLCSSEKFSEDFALEFDQTTQFALYFNSCVPMTNDDSSQPLGVILRDLGDKNSVKVTVKLWIETDKGTKLVEHLFSDFEFTHVDEKCGFSLERGQEFNFFNNCFINNGTLFLCGGFRYAKSDKNANTLTQQQQPTETDLLIQVEDRSFKAHKSVMIESSVVFKELLASGDSVLELTNIAGDVAEAMIAWIHFKSLTNLIDLAEPLFMAADEYKLGGLKSKCLDAMAHNITKENLFARLVLSFMYEKEAPRLKHRALKFASQKPHSEYLTPVFTSIEWLDLTKNNGEFAEQILNAIFDQI